MDATNHEKTPLVPASTASKAVNGGGTVKSSKAPHPPSRIAKPSRPRKAIAEFRKKSRSRERWTGRIGVHIAVDEIDMERVSLRLLDRLQGWEAVDFFDAIRLWQTEPPYIGHEQWNEWPMSEEEEDGLGEGSIDVQATMPEVYVCMVLKREVDL